MKIIKILGIAAGLHALFLVLMFANPGCSQTRAAEPDSSPISSAPMASAPAAAAPATTDAPMIRYSPTRPGTPVASALETQPVSDVVPATTYVVGHGDSLSSIASKNHLSKMDLASANNLKLSSLLHVGQKLIIPAKSGAVAPEPAGGAETAAAAPAADKPAGDAIHHVVKPGETLGAIARKYGVRQGDIAVANNITDPRRIQPGQDLVIPARSASGSKAPKGAKPKAEAAEAPAAAPAADQDLDAGIKTANPSEVPVVKIEDASQPKNP